MAKEVDQLVAVATFAVIMTAVVFSGELRRSQVRQECLANVPACEARVRGGR